MHFGHIKVAQEVAEKLAIAEVRMIPNGDPPHRQQPKVKAIDRLYMLDLTLADLPQSDTVLKSDALEIARVGKSYTVDTVTSIASTHPNDELYLLLGQDAFDGFYKWYRPNVIAELCTIIVINRPGYDSGQVNEDNQRVLDANTIEKIQFVQITPQDMSSTRIRTAFAEGREASIEHWLNPKVFHFIKEQQFYVE